MQRRWGRLTSASLDVVCTELHLFYSREQGWPDWDLPVDLGLGQDGFPEAPPLEAPGSPHCPDHPGSFVGG